MSAPAPPILELHLIEQTLALAIHLAARHQPLGNRVGADLSAPLNVLPRSLCPVLTSAALANMPWIDLDSCSRLGNLDLIQFMVTDHMRSRARLERDGGAGGVLRWRPLQWSRDSLKFAAQRGHLHVLEWWRSQQQVLITMDWWLVAQAAAQAGRVDVLEWWAVNRPANARLPWLYVYRDFEFSVHVLKWWLDRARDLPVAEEDVDKFLKEAICAGSVDGVQWMRDHGYSLDFSLIVQEANAHGQLAILDWVLATVPTREELANVCADYIRKFSGHPLADAECSSLYLEHFAVNQQLVIDWWISHAPWALFADVLEAKRAAYYCARAGYAPQLWTLLDTQMVKPSKDLLIAACESGDLGLVKALHERGCWNSSEPGCGCGSSQQCPTSSWIMASKSGNKDLLDWLLGIDQDSLTEDLVNACVMECGRRQSAECLRWWHMKRSDCPVFQRGYHPRLERHLEQACKNGNIEFIRFWMEALDKILVSLIGVPCVRAASEAGQLGVLDFMYSVAPQAVQGGAALCTVTASAWDRLEVLQWWKRHGFLPSECRAEAVDAASAAGYLRILDWWLHESGLQLTFTEAAMDNASKAGRMDVLEWWYLASLTHGIQLKYSPAALTTNIDDNDGVSGPRRMQTLRWWSLRGFQFPQGVARYALAPWPSTQEDQSRSVFIMGNALEVELLLKLGLQLGPTGQQSILDHATRHGHVSVLELLKSVLPVFDADIFSIISFEPIHWASERADKATVEWWRRAGFFERLETEMQEALRFSKGGVEDKDL